MTLLLVTVTPRHAAMGPTSSQAPTGASTSAGGAAERAALRPQRLAVAHQSRHGLVHHRSLRARRLKRRRLSTLSTTRSFSSGLFFDALATLISLGPGSNPNLCNKR